MAHSGGRGCGNAAARLCCRRVGPTQERMCAAAERDTELFRDFVRLGICRLGDGGRPRWPLVIREFDLSERQAGVAITKKVIPQRTQASTTGCSTWFLIGQVYQRLFRGQLLLSWSRLI